PFLREADRWNEADLWNVDFEATVVCPAAGDNTKMPPVRKKCEAFVKENPIPKKVREKSPQA
ncbi:MAG: hypothetical protein J6S78_05220, partial [Lachnospiraceae bacterium]|nr:hypothetical protein [Lachnospiraceae bacterium]